jgi:hypothetical protein
MLTRLQVSPSSSRSGRVNASDLNRGSGQTPELTCALRIYSARIGIAGCSIVSMINVRGDELSLQLRSFDMRR